MDAEGGERDPLIDDTEDRDDDEGNVASGGGNETTGFEPGDSSTPARRQTTMNRPGEQPSFAEFPQVPGHSTTTYAEQELIKEFPDFDRNKIRYWMDERSDRLKVALMRGKTIFYLITKRPGEEGISDKQTNERRAFDSSWKTSSRKP